MGSCWSDQTASDDAKPGTGVTHYAGGRQQETSDAQDVRPRIRRPFVTRAPTKVALEDGTLPFGALLTGGKALREAGLTGKGVRVAVIDSGVDADHPAFHGRVFKRQWHRHGTPLSEDDHGTHVAGTIHFMAPDAEIYDYRVFGEKGELSVDEAIAAAISDACNDGCNLINMSLGGPAPDPQIHTAVQYAQSQGVHMICAAGNDGDGDPLTNENAWPANHDETISIAALRKKDGFAADFSNSNPKVDYGGVGTKVVSMKPGGGFQEMSGTSMAAPHVAGLIAALLSEGSVRPNEKELRRMLTEKYAIDVGVKGPDHSTGVGFLTYISKDEVETMVPGW